MKYLYLMGGSGCGKTTLAMNLDKWDNSKYKRIIQTTTRKKRTGEQEAVDYYYVDEDEFDFNRDKAFEILEHQFSPVKYCACKDQLDNEKWNVVVVSIEGFLSALKNTEFNDGDRLVLVNILNDTTLDVEREGRDPYAEEKINLGVLRNFANESLTELNINNRIIQYKELNLSDLKTFRSDRDKTLSYFENLFSE